MSWKVACAERGTAVRVTAQLIDVRDGTHRWSETYDRPVGDMLQIQQEIATTLARALEVSVGADRQQSRRGSHNTAAYDLYLRGRNAYEQLSVDGMAAAATYFQQALVIDADFIDAAVALAETYWYQGNGSMVPARVAYENARRAAESALNIDSSLGLAHAVLGAVHSDYDRDWEAAELEFKQALALAPRDGVVLKLTAELPVALGQLATARRIYKKSLAYVPLAPDTFGCSRRWSFGLAIGGGGGSSGSQDDRNRTCLRLGPRWCRLLPCSCAASARQRSPK